MAFVKQRLMRIPVVARAMSPLNALGRKVFGDTTRVIRSGNWHGNDTLWRMVLDLNKVLAYANADGTLRDVATKPYIGIVDAIVAGEGEGPLTPDAIRMGLVIAGTNAVAIDAVCAATMGFAPELIPSVAHAFAIQRYPLIPTQLDAIRACIEGAEYRVDDLPAEYVTRCRPQFGWAQLLEERRRDAAAS